MPAPALLTDLLTAFGPSGNEEEAARVWRAAAGAFADVGSDTLGNSFARVRGEEGAITLAVVGHIDEVGVAITNVEENGLLSFTPIGVVAPETLHGQRIVFSTRNGPVPGLISRTQVYSTTPPKLELAELHVDIGAKSREEAERLVRPGDAAVWTGPPLELPNDRIVSKALDNRLGAYVALEAARRVAEAGRTKVDVVAVAAVQEEIGLYGARAAAYGLDAQVALVVDVTPANDVPGGDPKRTGRIELGMGALIARGPTLNRHVSELLGDVAEERGIAHGFEVYSSLTLTDADEIHRSRSGVPTGLISIPTRYLHSPNEMCDLADIESIVELVVAFAERLAPDQDFAR